MLTYYTTAMRLSGRSPDTVMSAQTAAIPLEIRIRHLELCTHGQTPTEALFEPAQRDIPSKAVRRQTQELEDKVLKAAQETEPLRRFVGSFSQYRPLLSVSSVGLSASGDALSEDVPINIADLVPADAKATLAIEAAADIKSVERTLREIQVLQQREVEGAGDLEDLLPLRPQLQAEVRETRNQKARKDAAQDELSKLLVRYSKYTSTTSDVFLDIHARLEALEELVTRLERKKRNAEAQKY